ncbi:hypothetical protein M413DRAFT_444460 [Hebeloma cylindrosporum]|uniref:Uncharacterized protein n=1 Tax=Hebeloma cylindrosporum TaxID=76867 RepID=A0A0C3CGR9_HEBCY|nr:hypothetical protein M413DRAFT_444460 [Hebeloma cylindrosporum h7]
MHGEGSHWGLRQELKEIQERISPSCYDRKNFSPPWKPKLIPFGGVFPGRKDDPERAYTRYQTNVVWVFEDIE